MSAIDAAAVGDPVPLAGGQVLLSNPTLTNHLTSPHTRRARIIATDVCRLTSVMQMPMKDWSNVVM